MTPTEACETWVERFGTPANRWVGYTTEAYVMRIEEWCEAEGIKLSRKISIKTFYRTALKLGYKAEGGNGLPADVDEPYGAFYRMQIKKWHAYKRELRAKQKASKKRSTRK